MNWSTVQDALRSWVSAATGVALASVIMAEQDGPRPTKPFATIRVSGIRRLGAFDGSAATTTAGTPDPGEEVTLTTGGHRELGVSVNVFTVPTQGASCAFALASKLHAQADTEGVRATMKAAGASLFEVAPVRNLNDVFRTAMEGRAQVDARLYVTESVTELTTYIEFATVNDGEANEIQLPEA